MAEERKADAKAAAPGTAGPQSAESLLREVRHAAGNLVHRMYYWTELLEAHASGGEAAEALAHLRSSLEGLQRLVGRSMELMHPAEVRLISIAPSAVVKSIALRMDAEPPTESLRAVDALGCQLQVDPILLDRALAMLGELICGRDQDGPANDRSIVSVDLDAGDPAGHGGGMTLFVRRRSTKTRSHDAQAEVDQDLGFALAQKLLGALQWSIRLVERDGAVQLRIFVPVGRSAPRNASRSSTHI